MLSTAEAEYVVVMHASKEAIWLRHLIGDLVLHINNLTTLLCNNQSTVHLTYSDNYCYALGPILLTHVSNVLIFCFIQLVWPDYVYHWFAWRPYQTFLLSQYLAALDSLTCPGSPSYSGLYSHGRATPLARQPLHRFWHAWVISTAITKISSVAYSVLYQASVNPCLACWCIASASCDSIFLWLGPSCIYSVCTRPESLQTWSPCNLRTINHLLELHSPALSKSSFYKLILVLRIKS